MKTLDLVALVLVIIGGLNWGLVGIADFNLVSALLGTGIVAKIIYIVVGLAALYMIYFATKK
ncbi:DUF378 domain-containing protein [Methanolobus psychrotolerans]|uniref:DUF378 domain-containing protein n=1 Tax=Methanolobus psychrotolerans TaxID=1874706 RepID=UPI000B915AE2|nr:DUF378 domain-containing protein [Methanolobus psychrotolerans]